jgi:hypothetical protein
MMWHKKLILTIDTDADALRVDYNCFVQNSNTIYTNIFYYLQLNKYSFRSIVKCLNIIDIYSKYSDYLYLKYQLIIYVTE